MAFMWWGRERSGCSEWTDERCETSCELCISWRLAQEPAWMFLAGLYSCSSRRLFQVSRSCSSTYLYLSDNFTFRSYFGLVWTMEEDCSYQKGVVGASGGTTGISGVRFSWADIRCCCDSRPWRVAAFLGPLTLFCSKGHLGSWPPCVLPHGVPLEPRWVSWLSSEE